MQIRLDFRSGIPIYVQIMEQIKLQVEAGLLHPGDQLPTVRQLAADLRVNFNTVARAYRLLDEAEIISTQHGRGTYILGEESPGNMRERRKKTLEELTQQFLEDAEQLRFSPEEVEQAFREGFWAWQSGRKVSSVSENTEVHR